MYYCSTSGFEGEEASSQTWVLIRGSMVLLAVSVDSVVLCLDVVYIFASSFSFSSLVPSSSHYKGQSASPLSTYPLSPYGCSFTLTPLVSYLVSCCRAFNQSQLPATKTIDEPSVSRKSWVSSLEAPGCSDPVQAFSTGQRQRRRRRQRP